MTEARIRIAAPADVADIARVHVRAWQSAYRGHIPDGYLDALEPEQRVPLWSKVVVDPSSAVLVGIFNHALVGFCSQFTARDADVGSGVAEISALYVEPGHWRAGVGRALLEAAVRCAREREFSALTLWVLAGNARARRFYEALGFELDGREKTEQRPGFSLHEVRYRRSLSD
ncbi:MAG: GNAT family N-acetyltransferase [Polyangiaceae bacterium]